MSGCYLFVRFCSDLYRSFPAKELDEVRDEELPSALDALAREWLEQHPEAPVAYQREVVAKLREASGKLILPAGRQASLSHKTLVPLPDDKDDAEEPGETGDGKDLLQRLTGTHPGQPLICRVAMYAGWGHPLPQPAFGGQVVSRRIFVARAKDSKMAEAAIDYLWRHCTDLLFNDWWTPHLGYCSESGFTKAERIDIETKVSLSADEPGSLVRIAQRVVNVVEEMAARTGGKGRPRISADEANIRARGALKGKPPKGPKWSQRTLAKVIGCAIGQISRLPAWQAYAEENGQQRNKRYSLPKAVGLTDKVLETAGQNDAELQRLMAEQRADDLAEKMRHRRRKTV
jgi:hypothetical protein